MILIGGMQKHQAIKTDGICTTLSASMGMGGGYIPMIMEILDEKQGGNLMCKNVIIDDSYGFEKNIRFYRENSPTLRSERIGLKTMNKEDNQYRIRKLTPKECFRLMGFSDEAFDKAQNAGISNSQLYKQAGNSIVTDVLYHIFKELYSAMPYLFNDLKVGSYFSGIGAFEIGLDRLYTDINGESVTNENFTPPQLVTETAAG